MAIKFKKITCYLMLLVTTVTNSNAAVSDNNPCGGSIDLLMYVGRPSNADSACVAPYKSVILESGYQYQHLIDGGIQKNAPGSLLRIGLADRFEINFILPNFVQQTVQPYSGLNASTLGIKHEIGSSENWVLALQGGLTLPSGSYAYGSRSFGEQFNGIFSYGLTPEINISIMMGVSSITESISQGGGRFASVNPDLVLSWSRNKVSLFWELYGQSKTGPQSGSGFNQDAGIMYELQKNIVVDIEVGQRISGQLASFNNYLGTGISIQFL